MNLRKIYFYCSLCLAILSAIILLAFENENEVKTSFTKIALRDVGNKLLLANQDSTSLILPVQKIAEGTFQLSFEKAITVNPDSLVDIAAKSFQKANLSSQYQIEVKQCEDLEVAYSFLQFAEKQKSIIPCIGRFLPQKCYLVEVRFFEKATASNSKLIGIVLLISGIILSFIFFSKSKKVKKLDFSNEKSIPLGKFQFIVDENKLKLDSTEINLSKKEVELLTVLVANPNKIIKREELSKKVWEDHGVFVGRSLDTYISKLRKKLSKDDSIKLTNIHGIGYMLEFKE